MRRQVALCSQCQFTLLSLIDGRCRAAKAIDTAITDLNEDNAVFVHRNNVDFAEPVTGIGIENPQAVSFEKAPRVLLVLTA